VTKKLAYLSALLISVLLISFTATPAMAADFRSGESITIPSGDTVNDDLYLSGAEVTIDGLINGDVVVFAQRITINGSVNGNVNAAGTSVLVKGSISKSLRAVGSKVVVSGAVNGDLVAAGDTVVLAKGGSIGRDLITATGSLALEGPVSGNVKGNAGKLTISSSVGGNVDVEVEQLKLDPSASINGILVYKSKDKAFLAEGASIKGQTTYHPVEKQNQPSGDTIGQMIAAAMSAIVGFIIALILVIAVVKYVAALFTGIILIVLAGKQMTEVIAVLKRKPWYCMGWGALLFFFVPVAIFIAFMLIIGIPLGAIALAAYIIGLYLGHIVIAIFVGKWMLRLGDDHVSSGKMIGALALGLFIVYLAGLIPFISIFSDLAVLLFGFGAITLYIYSKLVPPHAV
jgi:cytoskeletal protein CcmA (bactofilin family)